MPGETIKRFTERVPTAAALVALVLLIVAPLLGCALDADEPRGDAFPVTMAPLVVDHEAEPVLAGAACKVLVGLAGRGTPGQDDCCHPQDGLLVPRSAPTAGPLFALLLALCLAGNTAGGRRRAERHTASAFWGPPAAHGSLLLIFTCISRT